MKFEENNSHVAAGPIFHLVNSESRGRPLCGDDSPDAAIGSYVEHLDTSSDDARWVREVFGPDGKPAKACERCLALYPSVLI